MRNIKRESIREIFRIGRDPSSSHTMGPEKACRIIKEQHFEATRFEVILFGSLAKTGVGHRTDYAIEKTFDEKPVKIIFDCEREALPYPSTMRIKAYKDDELLCDKIVCSIGGGAIVFEGEDIIEKEIIYPQTTFSDIEEICYKEGITLCYYVERYENGNIREYLAEVWRQMNDTIDAGLKRKGIIPGGLEIKRKANMLMRQGKAKAFGHEKEIYMLSAYACAASEENASGEQMVTAPTCGASGVLLAVLKFKQQELGYTDEEIISSLEVASIVGNIIKKNASISSAECGCQAEIGTVCVMTAAAFAYLKGFSISVK